MSVRKKSVSSVVYKTKKPGWGSLLAVLAGVSAGFAAPQAAKADVTLYQGDGAVPSVIGYLRLDAGMRFSTDSDLSQYNGKKGVGTVVQSAGNDWGTSMFGVHGASQLSPDLQAIYLVESGFNATSGSFNSSSNSIFNRRAYGGLSNTKLGSLYFGKDLFIDNDIWGWDPTGQEFMSTATLVNGRNWDGASDMVEYRSPNWAGLQIGGQASFGNGDTSGTITPYQTTKVSNMYGVSIQYAVGPLSLLGVYDEMQDKNGKLTSIFSASREFIASAKLDIKPFILYAGYERLSAPDASFAKGGTGTQYSGSTIPNIANNTLTTLTGNVLNSVVTSAPAANGVFASSADNGWIGAAITLTPEWVVRTGWYYTALNDHGGHANLGTVGLEYYFSKNVFVYLTVGEVLNSGRSDFAANIGGPAPVPGHSQFSGFNGVSVQF